MSDNITGVSMFRHLAFLCVFLFASFAFANDRVVGHMAPYDDEMLPSVIRLDCGAMIEEVRGTSFDKATKANLNSWCSHARQNFFKFIDWKQQSTFDNREDKFSWNVSFLPIGTCYRCLNDETYRFRYRFVKGKLRERHMVTTYATVPPHKIPRPTVFERFHIVQPISRNLACGTTGMGAMAHTSDIVSGVAMAMNEFNEHKDYR